MFCTRADLDDMEPVWTEPTGSPAPGTLPPTDPSTSTVGRPRGSTVPLRIPMLPLRVVTFVALAGALAIVFWQVRRSTNGDPHEAALTWAAVLLAVVGAAGVLAWTWAVAENARRLEQVATVQDPPDPVAAVGAWAVPMGFAVAAAVGVAWLGRTVEPSDDGTSPIPLAVACGCLLVFLPLLYRPLTVLSGIVRRLGGSTVDLVQWVWVPVVLAAVGVGSLAVLRLLGMLDDDGGFAPTWALAVVAFGPAVLLVALGWRAAGAVEAVVDAAYRRRAGSTGSGARSARGRPAPSRPVMTQRGRVHQIPGVDLVRIVLVTMIAGLALISLVAAVVTFLFWNEARDDVLPQSLRDRVVDVLAALRDGERVVAFAALCVAAIWSFLAVSNVRLATGRRRNPVVAALSWPVAGAAIWWIGERFLEGDSNARVVVGLAAQSAVLFVPFLLLERAADAVGARRTPFRISWAFGVVLLVHIEGLAGLSTVTTFDDPAALGRTAGYLLLGSLVTLLSTLAVTEACRGLSDATAHEAERHNFLVAGTEAAVAARAGTDR
jgi:hypothetical protein